MIAGIDPALSGALNVIAQGRPVRGVAARSPFIPHEAKDLGNGSSAFKPIAGGTEVLVLSNASGAVTARCPGVAAATSNAGLRTADLQGCETLRAQLLSGSVRFAASVPAVANGATETPLALSISVSLGNGTPGAAASCSSEARKTVSYTLAGAARSEAVPIAANAAALGAGDWVETGERYVAYHCVIVPASTESNWSGRTTVVPAGWAIGAGPNDRRICRFSADLDRSGAVDNNFEHPDTYTGVRTSLTNQNFLVIRGNDACPTGSTSSVAGASATDFGTQPHQP